MLCERRAELIILLIIIVVSKMMLLLPERPLRTAETALQVVYDALVEAGVTILRAPSDGRFGRQFTFVDLDGYAITIYDRDAPAEGWSHTG